MIFRENEEIELDFISTENTIELGCFCIEEELSLGTIEMPILKGEKGDSATVEIGTVETVLSNEEADVENVGTQTNAILNFKIPKGDKGEDGLTEEEINILIDNEIDEITNLEIDNFFK